MTKIGAIVQVRMSSERLAGKTLYSVGDKPVLQYLLERLEHCGELDGIVVCTSRNESDEPIVSFCATHGVECCRGSLENVAERYKDTLERYPFDGFVRVNGDSPLFDHRLIDRGIALFHRGEYDLVTNAAERTYPTGQGVEVVRSETFLQTYPLLRRADEREHVTRYFYENPEKFRIFSFTSEENLQGIRLAVDTAEDMEVFAAIVAKMEKPHWTYRLKDVVQLYEEVTSLDGRYAVG